MDNKQGKSKYEDIIGLSYPFENRSSKRTKMSMHDRAAQFAPFAALTGHEEAIEETAQIHSAEHANGLEYVSFDEILAPKTDIFP